MTLNENQPCIVAMNTSQNSSAMPFSIFPLTLPNKEHQSPTNIYQTMFLSDPSRLLVIDTQKSYTLYNILSQSQIVTESSGRFESQLADNFEEVDIDGKSLILYSVDDCLYLHNIKSDRKVDSVQFKEHKYPHSSIYEEEYKFKLVPLFSNNRHSNLDIPYIVLFWKISALYKTGSRQISFQLRVLSFGFKTNQLLCEKLSLINQLQGIHPHMLRQTNFEPFQAYPKPIKLESNSFLDFTFAFSHPISYQTEGYRLQFSLLSPLGETKRKFTLNSIYNQLVKDVIPLKEKLLILTKHESMNLDELQREDQENIIHEEVASDDEKSGHQGKYAQNELFKQDFIVKDIFSKDFMKEKFNHLFEFQTSSNCQEGYFQEEERVDVYCISYESLKLLESSETEEEQHIQKEQVQLEDLKLAKLQSSLPMKEISAALSLVPNVKDSMLRQVKQQWLHKFLGDESGMKDMTTNTQNFHQVYCQTAMTLSHNHTTDKEALYCNQLVKITYSKPVLYMNILEKFWAKTLKLHQTSFLPNSNGSSQNSSELNYNQKSQPTSNPFLNLQQSNQNSFNELVISMLIQ